MKNQLLFIKSLTKLIHKISDKANQKYVKIGEGIAIDSKNLDGTLAPKRLADLLFGA